MAEGFPCMHKAIGLISSSIYTRYDSSVPLISAPGRQRQKNSKCKVVLSYRELKVSLGYMNKTLS